MTKPKKTAKPKRKPAPRIRKQSVASMVAEFRETLKRELNGMYAAQAKMTQHIHQMDKGIAERLTMVYELHHKGAVLIEGLHTAIRSQRDDIDYLLAEIKKFRMVATKVEPA